MNRPVVAMWLLERCDASGTREALMGDLLEEIAQGRPRLWIWQQVLAFLSFDVARRVRHHTPHSGHVIALAPVVSLLGVAMMVPPEQIVLVWVVLYVGSGTLSLFGDLVSSRSVQPGELVVPVSQEFRNKKVS